MGWGMARFCPWLPPPAAAGWHTVITATWVPDDCNKMSGRMTQPVLQLNNATVKKDHTTVLHEISLTIREGEHTAILGPNGAGKSILVRLLTHEERPLATDNGTPPVRVFGDENWNV